MKCSNIGDPRFTFVHLGSSMCDRPAHHIRKAFRILFRNWRGGRRKGIDD